MPAVKQREAEMTPLPQAQLGVKRGRNLTQQLVERLAARIGARKLKPGDKLPTEAELMTGYGVSRTVVREAISRLHAAGLVETRHGIGSFVRAPAARGPLHIDPEELATIKEVIAVLELRISLETEAAALAAERATRTQIVTLRRALDAFSRNIAQEGDAVDADFQFHLSIALSTGNRHFADLMSYLGTMIIPRSRINTARLARAERSAYLKGVQREHEAIYAAIERGNAEAARAAMRAHLAASRERLRRAHQAAAG